MYYFTIRLVQGLPLRRERRIGSQLCLAVALNCKSLHG